MPYGILKVDTITFTNGGVDQSVTVSGIVASTSGNLTVTGTISGNVIRGGTTVSGATVTGAVGQFGNLTAVSGVFTTQISGATVTGNVGQFTSVTGGTAGFTTVTGTTVTGTTANFVTVSGATVTGGIGSFTTLTGGVTTITSGVFATGSATNPSISFTSDPNTGIYSPGADQVAISTNGTGRLFVDSAGNIGIGTSTVSDFGGYQTLGINDTVGGFLEFRSSNTLSHGIIGDSNYLYVKSIANLPLLFGTNDIERMRLDSSGRLGLGSSAPATLFEAKSTTTNSARIRVSGTGTTAGNFRGYEFGNGSIFKGGLLQDESTDLISIFTPVGGQSVNITSAGAVGIGTTSPGAPLHVNGGDIILQTADPGTRLIRPTFAGGALQLAGSSATSDRGLRFGFVNNALSFSEFGRFDESGRLLVGTSSQPNTGGTLCVNNGIGIVNNTTFRFATVEHGSGASGTFTTITISATVQSSVTTVIFETLMTGFSGVYLDNVIGRYSGQAAVTMRNSASAGTSAALTVDGTTTIFTLTITTSVTHPVVKVKVTAGGLAGDITLPTITFA